MESEEWCCHPTMAYTAEASTKIWLRAYGIHNTQKKVDRFEEASAHSIHRLGLAIFPWSSYIALV